MVGPHEIVCLTGLGCTDRYCKGEFFIEVVEWGQFWTFSAQGMIKQPIACQIVCPQCLDTYVDQDFIHIHTGV